jgi:ribosomal protein L15E
VGNQARLKRPKVQVRRLTLGFRQTAKLLTIVRERRFDRYDGFDRFDRFRRVQAQPVLHQTSSAMIQLRCSTSARLKTSKLEVLLGETIRRKT